MNEIIDDRHPDCLRRILKVVEETSGSRKTVHERISAELQGGNRTQVHGKGKKA